MPAGTTAGAGGAFPGLGQAGAENARFPPRPRRPGLKLSQEVTTAWREPRWDAERRARSVFERAAAPVWRGELTRPFLGVPLPLFLRSPGEAKRNPGGASELEMMIPDFAPLNPGYGSSDPIVTEPVTTAGFI